MGTLFGGGDELVPIQHLEPGTVVRLKGDVVARVEENPRDGMWLVVRYLETAQGPVREERVEMVMSDDVLGVVPGASA